VTLPAHAVTVGFDLVHHSSTLGERLAIGAPDFVFLPLP